MNLADVTREFCQVPLGLINPPPLPARTAMDEQKLVELADSIRAIGVVQPLALVRAGDRYDVVAGHRRWTAANRIGLAVVPALVYPTPDDALEAVKLAENLEREPLNPADEALYFSDLLEQRCGGDTNRLAELLKRKRDYVESRLLLFQGDPKIFDALRQGTIGIGVAHQLNRCTDELHRRMLLYHAVREGANVSVVTGWITQWKQQTGDGLHQHAPAGEPLPPGPVMSTNYFTCYVCGGTDHVHLMQPVNIHAHCRLAILDPLLGHKPADPAPMPFSSDPRRT